ncbi:Crp/Fnr family transcriptional regulator [Aphanothece hegewaldii CCALA 016]|uniref:Crp/Fnr family transcriptional regulator n=1 Tax=Aphanothece hegewaldii CCALA 016 TaxID=2107694 RepID=A0A2T1LYG2_9CHRO|nr:Crp/Fnr family transcriptional regulator [Aphanothece hegewaldii]PSF37433.1 Crp/Fnr family transcriptional regulator [Aphanothece hegewaldii CCALA 016]
MSSSPDPRQNRLLASLPDEEYNRLLPLLKYVPLELKKILYEVNEPIQHVYFPLHGVISLLTIMEDESIAEVGTIGNEGFVGLPVFLGAEQVPGRALAQVSGDAMRMDTQAFKREVKPEMVLFNLLQRYTQAMFNQIAQTAACNRLHNIEERFCRWILMSQDRVHTDQFFLTQEFLSQMLGVRRAAVNKVATTIQKAGLIQYIRGKMTILDREGLESSSCECYAIIKAEYDRLLDGKN